MAAWENPPYAEALICDRLLNLVVFQDLFYRERFTAFTDLKTAAV